MVEGNTFSTAGDFPILRKTFSRRRETFRTFGKHFSDGRRLSGTSGKGKTDRNLLPHKRIFTNIKIVAL